MELLRNPELLKRAQAEVRQVLKKQGYVNEEELEEIKYMKAVIKETMRLHPPFPLLLASRERCEINGNTFVNAWTIGREQKRPERVLECEIDYKGFNFEFIPFGAGRRICPGMSLALAANLLFHFD